jgi:hypothetical protein
MPNLLIAWDNPVNKTNVNSIVLYRKKDGTSCEDVLVTPNDLLFETTNFTSEKGYWTDVNIQLGTWRYAAFSKNEAGLSPCTTSVFEVLAGPVIDNAIDDLSVYEGAPSQDISITSVFSGPGGGLTYSVLSSNANVVNAALVGTDVHLTFAAIVPTDQTAQVEVTATANGFSVVDSFNVTVFDDNAPVVVNPISNLATYVDAPDVEYDLSNTFSDVDGDTIIKTAVSSDTSKVTVSVNGDVLTVSPTTNVANIGAATITVTGTSNNKSVDTYFQATVTVELPGCQSGDCDSWSNIGRTPPDADSLPGGPNYTVPVVDEGDTSNVSNDGTCSDAIVGTLNSTFFYDRTPGTPCASVRASTGPYSAFGLDQWFCLTLVRLDNTAALYVNGIATAVISLMDSGAEHNQSQIGALYASTYQNDWCWNGLIDQAAVWGRAISAEEVRELYNDGDGVSYANMSSSLKTSLTTAIECDALATYMGGNTNGTNLFSAIKNKVNNTNANIRIQSQNTYPMMGVALTLAGGKVSDYSFSPCRDPVLRDASSLGGTSSQKKAAAVYVTKGTRAAIIIPGNPWPFTTPSVPNVAWSTSVWLKKYGEARSYSVAQKIGTGVASSWAGGALFADYRGFSGANRWANLYVTDKGNTDPAYPLWNL